MEAAKLEWIQEKVPEMIAQGRTILIFSQFTGMLDLIGAAMVELRIPLMKLTGETPEGKRGRWCGASRRARRR
ncbi:hypothetical protein [Roseateles chitinivorans]|uniref:hypothetical protein n=1 Tax=Roseateles chitinivorans TaxID=2917965 RepID=UPI003D67773D